MELLVQPGIKKAKTLSAEILSLKTSVAGFCESWKEQNLDYAYEQSDMAFRSLDHIQNEILRIRDDKKTDANWQTESFKQALDLKVGHVLAGVTSQEKVQFSNAKNGLVVY
jgi:GH18 family chitinase